jgi:polyhydroxybutyrate depolymerase
MDFDTATQSFEIVDIAEVGAPDTGAVCPSSSWSSGDYTLEQNGIAREFRVRLPTGYRTDQAYPLIVLFHGWGGDEGEFLDNVTVQSQSDQRGYVLVAPLGLGREEPGNRLSSWSFQGSTTGLDGDGLNAAVSGDTNAICDDDRTPDYTYPSCGGIAENGCSWTQCSVDDVAFSAALVQKVSTNVCIDSDRVYAVGGSNGGMFVWDLGRDERSAEVFRAVAPILGLPHRGYLDPPVSESGMPVISITGSRDRTVPPGEWGQDTFTTTSDGDVYYYSSASAITKVWAEAHGCDTTVPAEPVDIGSSSMECRGWSYCQGDSQWPPVMDCRGDMGHVYNLDSSWPLILDFFEQL